MDTKIAVLTLVKGRKEALLNLIKGLSENIDAVTEMVIVHMNEDVYPLPQTPFPMRALSLYSEEKLPLAKARNFAMSQTNATHCIFLDVDCIPAADFISAYTKAFSTGDRLWSGQVRYLKTGFPEDEGTAVLAEWSDPDPVRGNLTTLPYELFWSLNFGCSKAVFEQIGGFDESYHGYGAEDTDFSFTAREKNVEMGMVNATVYHQPHPSYDPPLNHLEDIVKNASVFFKKWNRWPMEGWLKKFVSMGYALWDNDRLMVLHRPSPIEMNKYLRK
jgi:hypothetical protein